MSEQRTRSQAKQWIQDNYGTIANWARQNGFTLSEVIRVLDGTSKCRWGKAREVAIKLNIKLYE